jgi:hypothetical protein
MELKDFIFTPIILVLVYFLAYYFRDRLTNQQTHAYFIPALTVKLIGAISLGVIYQFYYHGGDTLNYFDQSKVIHQAFLENPMNGLRLLMANGTYQPSTFEYATRIYWYRSPSEYFIIKLAAIFGLLSGHSYSSIAVCFAAFGFSGIWAMYQTFVKIAPPKHFALALGILFVPSVFFWGSGLMKDTITLGALGWLFYGFHHLVIEKRFSISTIFIITIAFYIVYQVKLYILLSFLPPAIFWFFLEYGARIRQKVLRVALKPLVLAVGLAFAYLAAVNVTEGDNKYDINKIGERTKINAEYLYRISISQKGSAYHLGSLDGTIESMLRMAPQAVNVTLFRPYLWEIENPLMFISALESLIFSLFFLSLFFKPGLLQSIHILIRKPVVIFCFIFTLILAFAVGLNSYNFGTLVRYKIQLLPFFLSGIVLVKYYASSAVPSGLENSQRVIITE